MTGSLCPLLSGEIQGEYRETTILKTLSEWLETMLPEANIKEFEAYDGKRPVRYMSTTFRTNADRNLKIYCEMCFHNGGSRESI